jgi:hypothetical protein
MASLKSLVFGGCAGALAYLVVMPLHSPWEEAIAAALIGCVPALVRRSPRSASLGAAACVSGWVVGTVIFGSWVELGIGAWAVAGAGLGLACGLQGRGFFRAAAGLGGGLIAGLAAELSRYLTVVIPPIRTWDMQLLLLVGSGALLLMEEVDSTFSKANRVRRQLDYAAQLGLGEPDLRKIELVRIE